MDNGKNPLLLLYTYSLSSSTMGLLLYLQYYQRCEPLIFEMWVQSKFFLLRPGYYNLLTEKRMRKFTFLKYSFFWKHTVTVNLKKIFSNTNFRWYTFSKLYILKFIYFSGRPNKLKEMFWNIFVWPLCWWYWK